MELTHIDLSKLTLTAINMRHGKRPPDVSDILPSIRARGVLVPLLVRPNGADDRFEIVAGRRRFFAAKAVAEEGADIDTLPCAVMDAGDDAAALEASLLENLARLDPDAMTQFETFARLTKEGRSVTEIGTTFGVTEIMVKRRLALGNLLPKIREAYRNDEIDDESIRQLTLASKAQQRAWLKLFEDPEHYVPMGHDLKAWLFGGHEIPTEVALFPLDTYSGQIVADLFGERSYFANTEQFWRLQNEAIAAQRDALLVAGWSEVTILEPGQRFHEWEYERTVKEQGGRVYVSVSHRGEVEIHEGYLTRKEARRLRQTSEPSESPSDGTAATPARCEMSKSMQNYLELHRHAAARVALLRHPGIALRLMVAHVLGGSDLWSVKPEPQDARSADIAESVAASSAQGVFDEERRAVLALHDLPPRDIVAGDVADAASTGVIFAKLLDLSDEEVLRIAAYVMAETAAVGTAAIEAVGNHVGIDMAEFWQPDEAFFDLVRGKAVVNAMLAEVAGKAVADQNVSQKVATQKKIIQDSVAGANGRERVEGWLPGYLAFPFRAYTDQGGGRVETAWQSVASHIQCQ